MKYNPSPTKETLLAYFSKRIAIRKMHEIEAFRLMDVSNEDIAKINAYPFKSKEERESAILNATPKELSKIKRDSICKTAKYKLAGNSIVVSNLYYILKNLFMQPEITPTSKVRQMTIFDIMPTDVPTEE